MIFPLINYSANYQLDKKPYAVFQFIEKQHLVKSTLPFTQNNFNLVANLLHTNPLIMLFYLDKAFRGYHMPAEYASTILRATFFETENGTLVKINVRSNWVPVFFYGMLSIGLSFAIIYDKEIIPYMMAIYYLFSWKCQGNIVSGIILKN